MNVSYKYYEVITLFCAQNDACGKSFYSLEIWIDQFDTITLSCSFFFSGCELTNLMVRNLQLSGWYRKITAYGSIRACCMYMTAIYYHMRKIFSKFSG